MKSPQQASPFSRIAASIKQRATAPSVSSLLRFLLILLAISPVGYTTYRQWPEVRATLLHVQWSSLAISIAILFLSMPLMGVIPWLTLRSLHVHRSPLKIMGLYFVSQLTKYLPGGIWAYPTRVATYQVHGVGKVQSIISVAREVIFLFLGAALAASFALFAGVGSPSWMQLLVIGGVLGCFLGILLTSSSRMWTFLAKFPPLRTVVDLNENNKTVTNLRWLDLLPSLLTSYIYWLSAGVSFLYLVKAVTPSAPLQIGQAIALFALAWCVGFMIVVLPAGFGARETAILYLLKSFIPLADAVAVSLLARLAWMAAEALWTALLASRALPDKRPYNQHGVSR